MDAIAPQINARMLPRLLRASGIAVKHVARETGYTERRIYQLEREGNDDNQPDLFEP